MSQFGVIAVPSPAFQRTLLAFSIVALLSMTAGNEVPGKSAAPLTAPASRDSFERTQRYIAQREYWASRSGEHLQAPNRRQRLRTYFAPEGIRVVGREAGESAPLLDLSLQRFGREPLLEPVLPGAVHAEQARVEIRRTGLVEWFENGPRGLEQGFTLERKPEGDGPLAFELALAGARAELTVDRLVFVTPEGHRLEYGALAAWDADGKDLPARLLTPGPGRIAIHVDDSGARYPVTVDPLLTWTSDTQLEPDQTYANLGSRVASAGDVNGDGFSDVIVGAPGYDAGLDDEGAAFLFLGSAQGIASGGLAVASAVLEGEQEYANLGQAVASAGDVNGDGFDDVIVGAPGVDGAGAQIDVGGAYIFLGSASGIASGSRLTAHTQIQGTVPEGHFGASVAAAGNVNGDAFDDVIVGSPDWEDPQPAREGAAFVFLGSAAGIVSTSPATAHARLESNKVSAGMGQSVSSAGDVNDDGFDDVIVGSPRYSFDQVFDGAAFIFLGSASGIANGSPATAHARLDGDHANQPIGRDVASAGDVNADGFSDVIVGAPDYYAGQIREGAAFVFLGSATGILSRSTEMADAQLESNQENGFLSSVASAGDVNGDGFDDVIVGASGYDAGQLDEGAAFVFLGSATGLADGNPLTAFAQLESNQAGAKMGLDVASAGDVNGDDVADVIVGADHYAVDEIDEGAAFVFLGSSTADNCPFFASPDQTDTDLDGRGDVCECTDQNGDGRNTVSDLVAINSAIFDPLLVTPLCDGNGDGSCNVNDIVAASNELFSPSSTSTCARQPVPGP